MAGRIQFWFEFASTYSYLSAMRIEEAAGHHGVAVDWQPFLLGPIFAAQGWTTSPFNLYPAKGRYMWRDMARLCSERDLPFQRPDSFPQNGLMAARLALVARAHGRIAPFARAVYAAQFAQGLDIAEPQVLTDCWQNTGLDVALMDAGKTHGIKSELRTQTETAQSLDVFGAPSFVVADELYWGDDRLDQAILHAASI